MILISIAPSQIRSVGPLNSGKTEQRGLHSGIFAFLMALFVLLFVSTTQLRAARLNWSNILEIGQTCSGLPKDLIMSVIIVESNGNPNAVNINGVGGFQPKSRSEAVKLMYRFNKANVDIGLMQVNYLTWGPVYGITPERLLDPAANVCIGSRILRDYIDRHKGSWRGVGRYNAVSYNKQVSYALRVSHTLAAVRRILYIE